MISRLIGHLVETHSDHIVVDVQGVGYEVFCSLNTLADLQAEAYGASSSLGGHRSSGGASASSSDKLPKVTLFIHTHVREEALQLFGFSAREERVMFQSLLKVSGIGPKSALNILSGASVSQIQSLIEGEDVKALSKLPKVGKKTAEHMILALKGKLVIAGDAQKTPAGLIQMPSPIHQDIASALVNLGFKNQDVEKVVLGLEKEISLQEGIRQGLSALASI